MTYQEVRDAVVASLDEPRRITATEVQTRYAEWATAQVDNTRQIARDWASAVAAQTLDRVNFDELYRAYADMAIYGTGVMRVEEANGPSGVGADRGRKVIVRIYSTHEQAQAGIMELGRRESGYTIRHPQLIADGVTGTRIRFLHADNLTDQFRGVHTDEIHFQYEPLNREIMDIRKELGFGPEPELWVLGQRREFF